MDKVTTSSKNITPFGGLNFIYDALNRSGIDKFINKKIGSRNVSATYSYSDVVLSLFGNTLVQGSFISDLEILKEKYSDQVFHKIPSPDTVEYVCQELKQNNIVLMSSKGVKHELNYNQKFNEALICLGVKTNQLKANEQGYVLDFDNVVIENGKQDAKLSYKKVKGYHPNIALIGRIPVHIENHNGNTPARFEQYQTIGRCFENLNKQSINIEHFRADSASYQMDIINAMESWVKFFYIRMMDFEDIRYECAQIKEWETVRIGNEFKEVASVQYQPKNCMKAHRVVVVRNKRKDGQIDLLSGSAYTYQGIITSNNQMSEQEVIEFYNARGDAENSNRYLLNDFNFNHLPFPDMDTNTVYMYLMAMCCTLFEWTKTILVKNKATAISLTMRTKAVCFHYITIATTFVKHARKRTLKVFGQGNYAILKI
ncbi:MAG: IS1380 family transposase [Bacteroidota bacterium]|nr:IS1380 family transposase [Bacteroidota bacterium]